MQEIIASQTAAYLYHTYLVLILPFAAKTKIPKTKFSLIEFKIRIKRKYRSKSERYSPIAIATRRSE